MTSSLASKNLFSTRLGFILSSAGAAVGLGNIQRFPYLVSEGGGALFVLVYLLCLLLIGIPLILVEFSIGAAAKTNPKQALIKLSGQKRWGWFGFLGILVAFFIFSYYSIMTSWTLAFGLDIALGNEANFTHFTESPSKSIPYVIFIFLLCGTVLSMELRKGLERICKFLMPLLVFLLAILIIKSIFLPNSIEGIKYYLLPNFDLLSPKILVLALGQAFFSLCIGEAVLVTFASYAQEKEDMVLSAFSIALFDTLVALGAGFVIFPSLFAFGLEPSQGIGLIFTVMPKVFAKMPLGYFFSLLFFGLLVLAAFTTLIALLEMPINYLVETKNLSRKKAATVVLSVGFLLSIPSLFSKGASDFLSSINLGYFNVVGFYEIMDFIFGSLGMVVSGLFLTIFVGYKWGVKNAASTLAIGSSYLPNIFWNIWSFLVKYVAPIAIILILLSVLFF